MPARSSSGCSAPRERDQRGLPVFGWCVLRPGRLALLADGLRTALESGISGLARRSHGGDDRVRGRGDRPANAFVVALLFAFSGLRFAGLPAHKALVVGPAERDTGGRISGAYYLVRNAVVIPSAAFGGALYGGFSNPLTGGTLLTGSPTLAFGLATAIGTVETAYFLAFGKEFEAYA